MKFYPDRKQAQEIDRYTQEVLGLPGIVLMERAAMKLAECIEEALEAQGRFDKKRDKILAVTEGGNNGGDAVAAARMLKCKGYDTYIYEIGGLSKKTESYRKQIDIAKNLKVGFIGREDTDDKFSGYSVIIDGIFGVGLTREVTGLQAEVIGAINRASSENGCFVVGCDVPSGIGSDDGRVLGTAVKCDMTVSFQYIKYGCLVGEGREYSGQICCEDIGLYRTESLTEMAEVFSGTDTKYLFYEEDEERVAEHLPVRRADANKGSCGKVLIVAGSEEIYGALYLCAEACLKSGAGLVRIVTHDRNKDLVMEKLPEAMMLTYDDKTEQASFDEAYQKSIAWADVILAGPGLGTGSCAEHLLHSLIGHCHAGQSIVFDADALNLLSTTETKDAFALLIKVLGYEHVILTPHMGEMQRLLQGTCDMKQLKEERADVVSSFADENGVICVLKDSRTLIGCTGAINGMKPVYVNTTGNAGMAKGGSGDVLAGMIAGILAQNTDDARTNYEMCCAAVHLHGAAGDRACDALGEHRMLARDIIGHLRML